MGDVLTFSNRNRGSFIDRLKSETFDLLVIGGGITGAGIALDGATRGLKVALIEKDDFGSGTSGKSTKLIHGGLRYLKQFEFGLVKEVGQERAVLHKLAPHLVVPEKMLLPLIEGGSMGRVMTSIGLYIYDFLADVESGDKRRMLDKDEILELEPLLPGDRLLGGSIYAEYRTDDARLTIEVLKTAQRHGAVPMNYVMAQEFSELDGKICAVVCQDLLHQSQCTIRAKVIVNATGPWVDDVRTLTGPIHGKRLYLTKGVHLVVPHSKLPVRQAVYFDVPGDRRMIFCIPRLSATYIGTTDTYYEGDKDNVRVESDDVDYLLNAVNRTFPQVHLQLDDIISGWAGIRPLIYEDGKSASEISRRDEIFESDNGLISIAGGKLTGYRKMSERVVDLVLDRLEAKDSIPCVTKTIPLTKNPFGSLKDLDHFKSELEQVVRDKGLARDRTDYLLQNYGTEALAVLKAMDTTNSVDVEGQLILAELSFCMENELATTLADFLVRRTGRMYFMPESISQVLNLLAGKLKEEWPGSPVTLGLIDKEWMNLVQTQGNFQ